MFIKLCFLNLQKSWVTTVYTPATPLHQLSDDRWCLYTPHMHVISIPMTKLWEQSKTCWGSGLIRGQAEVATLFTFLGSLACVASENIPSSLWVITRARTWLHPLTKLLVADAKAPVCISPFIEPEQHTSRVNWSQCILRTGKSPRCQNTKTQWVRILPCTSNEWMGKLGQFFLFKLLIEKKKNIHPSSLGISNQIQTFKDGLNLIWDSEKQVLNILLHHSLWKKQQEN